MRQRWGRYGFARRRRWRRLRATMMTRHDCGRAGSARGHTMTRIRTGGATVRYHCRQRDRRGTGCSAARRRLHDDDSAWRPDERGNDGGLRRR